MKRSAFAAALVALGLAAGAAQAQAPLDATGWMPGGGNVVGGGLGAAVFGGGDDATVVYSAPGAGAGAAGFAQAGRAARFAGAHGDGPQVEYTTSVPAGEGREARLVGGGDDAQVVYGPAR